MAGMFPEKYMTAVVSGQALGGVFASGARIVSLSVGADDATSAFIYFMIAVAVMILTLGAYLYMANTVSRWKFFCSFSLRKLNYFSYFYAVDFDNLC